MILGAAVPEDNADFSTIACELALRACNLIAATACADGAAEVEAERLVGATVLPLSVALMSRYFFITGVSGAENLEIIWL